MKGYSIDLSDLPLLYPSSAQAHDEQDKNGDDTKFQVVVRAAMVRARWGFKHCKKCLHRDNLK